MIKQKGIIHNLALRMLRYPLAKDTLITTTLNITGKGVGLLVPFFIAAWFGLNLKTDIFFFVYAIILYLTGIFSYSLEANVVPFVAELRKQDQARVPLFINQIVGLNFLIMLALVLILLLVARPLSMLITHFPEESADLLFKLLVAISPLLILITCSSILSGILNAYFKFWLPAISPGIRAVVCIATIFALKPTLGIQAVVFGYVLGELARLIIFTCVLIKKKIILPKFNITFDRKLLLFFKVATFQIVAMATLGLTPLVDKAMASWLTIGSVSILQYSDRLYYIPETVISSGLIVVILSHWSARFYQHKDTGLLKKDMQRIITIVAALSAMLILLGTLFSSQIVNIAYARGKFPIEQLSLVRQTFLFYLAGLIFYSTGQVLTRAHIVLKNTKAFMKIASVSVILNILLNLILMRLIGVRGIALASSIVSAVVFVYSYRLFNRKRREIIAAQAAQRRGDLK